MEVELSSLYTVFPWYILHVPVFRFDEKHSENEVTYLECFCVITSGIKDNANGTRLKQMIIDKKILTNAIEYITGLAPPVKTLLAYVSSLTSAYAYQFQFSSLL